MELYSVRGPFDSGQIITFPNPSYKNTFVHIGLQYPYGIPISPNLDADHSTIQPDFRINDQEYKINKPGILEFEITEELNLEIECLHYMPPETVIDVAYIEKEN